MAKEIFNAEQISIKELEGQRGCGEYILNRRLSLKTDGSEANGFYIRWISLLKTCASEGCGREEAEGRLLTLFDEEYLEEWFPMTPVWEASKARELALAIRVADAFYAAGYSIKSVDAGFSVSMGGPVEYHGASFGEISDVADVIATTSDGVTHIVKFVRKTSYNMRARRQDRKPENALPLVVMAAAFIEQYPGAVYELWSIQSSGDSGTKLSEKVQVVSYAFPGFETSAALMGKLKDVIGLPVDKPDCGTCNFRTYCHKAVIREKVSVPACEAGGTKRLTEAQEQIADHVDGPLVAVAVPGSGKTTCLVERCVRLFRKGIPMRNVLLVSFTKKAAAEITDRLVPVLGEGNLPIIRTLNAFGNDILVKNAGMLGRRVRLASDTDCKALIEKAVADSPVIPGMSYNGFSLPFGIVSTLYKWFGEIAEKGEVAFREAHGKLTDETVSAVLAVKEKYDKMYLDNGYISYDDQITLAVDLFKKHPGVAEAMSKIYRYIMVDEYQDVNEAQAEMLDLIAKNHGNIVVVGDDDQSIYGWRGGSNKFMLEFSKRYPGAEKVTMSDNFRSTEQILSASQSLIHHNDGKRFEKVVIPHLKGTNKPCIFRNFGATDLPAVIRQAEAAGFEASDCAIIARKNRALEEIAGVLNDAGIKSTSPKDYLIDDAVFLGIKDVLTIAYTGIEDLPLARLLINLGVPKHLLVREKAWKGSSLYEQCLSNGSLYPFEGEGAEQWEVSPDGDPLMTELNAPVLSAGKKIRQALRLASTRRVSALPEIAGVLFGDEAVGHPAVSELLDMADERAIADLKKFLPIMESCERYADTKRVAYGNDGDTVNLLTAHDSKGKEFPFVIIFGLEDFEDDEEGVRLLYVAMTRAKKSLFITEGALSDAPCENLLKEGVMIR